MRKAESSSETGIEVNRIYNEDCLDTMSKMPDNLIDLVVTSPPYDSLRDYNGYEFNFEGIAEELFRVVRKGGVVVWVTADATVKGSETGSSFKQALYFMQCGFNLFDTMIYSKPPRGAVGDNRTYWQSFEYMFILSKGSPKTINLIKDRENKEARKGDNGTKRLQNGDLLKLKRGGYGEYGRRTNIWEYRIGRGHSSGDKIAHEHPAIFPERLAQDHIISWSNEGDLVYDPMIGSGTVAKMCIQENREYIGSEVNGDYCQLAEKRMSNYQKSII